MTAAILPGSTIGILGGGQLGRMVAMAARSFGYRIQVMDPDPSCPARFVVDACFEGAWDDAQAAADLARGCDVVTLEIEQVSIACLEAAAKYAPVRPSAELLHVIQNRIRQKEWLRERGFPLGPWHAARSEQDVVDAVVTLGGRCFVKSAHGGYDGRSQVKIGFGDEHHRGRCMATARPTSPVSSNRLSTSIAKFPSWSRVRRAARQKAFPPRPTTTSIRFSPGA